ncbi:MAG: tripartite tricarboxylate transporter substrate binding protein [Xanthobacteraceae bacterium]|nr:tripartite tricarboxylate transporter substrate binding protein [Xanthobacteraceae bacterium]
MIGKRTLLCAATATALTFAIGGPAVAQTYPDKPVKIIVAVAAGGPMDTMARAVAQQMQAKLGQPVVVENRPGAGTTIGAKAVFTAEPDGLTLLWGTLSMVAIAPVIYKDLDFDPTQLLPVALVAEFPSVLVVPPSLPVHTLAEFVAYAKANRGKLNYGGSLGTPPMLMGMKFNKMADLGMTYVPYRGGAPSIPDLIAGRLQMQWDALTLLAPLIREGKLKGLAVQTPQRWPALPDVPTLAEAGIPDFPGNAWAGIMAPPKTPQPVVARINATINDILQAPETKTALANLNVLLRPGTPQDFAAFITKETPAWSAMAKESGATAH